MSARVVRAPRGRSSPRKSWLTEAPLRMLHEQSRSRGGRDARGARGLRRHRPGRAQLGLLRRDPRRCERLEDDETLLVQSGKPVGVFKTHADAPRVLIANSNLVPHWATWEHFNELDRKGLMMYGQMTAGSWIYIGTQGIVQGTYETFAEAGRQHFGGDLAGRWILTAGLGGMGGAQPLAATMAGASLLRSNASRAASRCACEPVPRPAGRRPRRGAGDDRAPHGRKAAVSVGLLGNAAELVPRTGDARKPAASSPTSSPTRPARTTRPTATCRAAGRCRSGKSCARATRQQRARGAARESMRGARAGDARLPGDGRSQLRLRQQHPPGREGRGRAERVRLPGLRAGLHPAAVLRRQRAVPLGRAVGRSRGHLRRPTRRSRSSSPTTRTCTAGSTWRASASRFQGLPARICWLGLGAAPPRRPRVQRDGARAASSRRRSSSAATTSTRARSRARTARPKPCATAPTPSPTGRC